jgi:hypothetical protein
MSQPPSEERRKFVFVFTGPAVRESGKPCAELMQSEVKFAEAILGWKSEMSLDLPLSARVEIKETDNATKSQT